MRRLLVITLSAALLGACTHHPVVHHAYTGRLHVAFRPAADAWTMTPPPARVHAIQPVSEAKTRAHSQSAEVGGTATRVYFGLFTGKDDLGGAHNQTPAWLVVGTHVKMGDQYGYGVVAFADDLTQPWVSLRLTLGRLPTPVY